MDEQPQQPTQTVENTEKTEITETILINENEKTEISSSTIVKIENEEDELIEQLRLKKLQLKMKLELSENKDIVFQEEVVVESIEINEERRKQILNDTFIDFKNSLKEYCNGPALKSIDFEQEQQQQQQQIQLENFYKGSKWSPDGTCLLSCSEDKYIRLFEIPFNTTKIDINMEGDSSNKETMKVNEHLQEEILKVEKAVIEIKEFESIYDYCWYPFMNSNNPASCCFLTSSKEYPITLWDAFTGKKRCTYKPYKDVDDLESAYSIQFNSNGNKIYGGFKKSIKIFDIDRPGDEYQEIKTTFKKSKGSSKIRKKRKSNQNNADENINLTGIISSIAFDKNTTSGFFAASTYNGNIGLFDERIDTIVDIIPDPINLYSSNQDSNNNNNMIMNPKMGITQIMFSPKDSNYLFAAYRKSNYIIGWDIRNTVSQQVYQLYRPLDSHQRLQFDIDPISSRYLSTGTQNGDLLIYDLFENGKLSYQSKVSKSNSNNCINSTSFHPFLPFLSLTFGERQFDLLTNKTITNNEDKLSFSILKY